MIPGAAALVKAGPAPYLGIMILSSSAAPVAPAGEALCLDFVNTRFWRGSAAPTEQLVSTGDLEAWLAATLPGWPAAAEPATTADLDGAVALREALFGIFQALAARESATQADLSLFNRMLLAAPARAGLVQADGGFAWQAAGVGTDLASRLAPVLWSAGDLLTGPRRERVRLCANPQCRWLFVDDSKNLARRWCDMASCGNRAKAHRHYQKRKAAREAAETA